MLSRLSKPGVSSDRQGYGGARAGAGRPSSGNKPVTMRLPPKLIEKVRREAESAGQTISDYVAARLR